MDPFDISQHIDHQIFLNIHKQFYISFYNLIIGFEIHLTYQNLTLIQVVSHKYYNKALCKDGKWLLLL
jgi:hypothetical protein